MHSMNLSIIIALFLLIIHGASFADSSGPILYSQEVSLWPEGSKVLADGIKKIESDEYTKDYPWLAITHPTFIRYTPKADSARAAIIVFPGGDTKV